MHETVANRGRLITSSAFSNYDHCLNTYVGCGFGCKYCYVRFFVKDKEHEWGQFVRLREHVRDKLPKELASIGPIRLAVGTMTDPYQPVEKKHRLTRQMLEHIKEIPNDIQKVGIFTRSPIVLDDAELIAEMPKGRVHYTVSMYDDDVTRKIEPVCIKIDTRFKAIKELKEKGVRVHINLAPVIPVLSDHLTEEFAQRCAEIEPAEIFIDPLQPYGPSFKAIDDTMSGIEGWEEAKEIIRDKKAFREWKQEYHERWKKAWEPHKNLKVLPLYCDHVSHRRTDLRNDNELGWDTYDDEA